MTEPSTDAHDSDDPVRCGKYVLIEPPLGEGTFGVVYRAEHADLGSRFYAVKVLRQRFAESPRKVARFRREATSLARLRHKGLCTVIDWGFEQGRPWFSMEYIEGRTLEALISDRHAGCSGISATTAGHRRGVSCSLGRDEIAKFVEIVAQVALALQHAHDARVIHRDVKPRNIMVDLSGEPRIVDFGLAKDFPPGAEATEPSGAAGSSPFSERDIASTLEWEETGTLPYMPPESLVSSGLPVDNRFDVWSLGVTIFECLTGELPFRGSSTAEIRKAILGPGAAPSLRDINPNVSRELEAVVLTALEKDISRRYGSARAFADDLGRVLRREPILARPTSIARRAVFFVRRQAGAVLIGLAGLMVVSTSLVMGIVWSQLALNEKEKEIEALQHQDDNFIQRLRETLKWINWDRERLSSREAAAIRRVADMMRRDPATLETAVRLRFEDGLVYSIPETGAAIKPVPYVYSGRSEPTLDCPEFEGNQRAFKLDGDSYLEIAAHPSLDLTGSFLIDFWIKPSAIGGFVLMKGNAGGAGESPQNYSIDLVDESGEGGAGLHLRFGFSGPEVESKSVKSERPLELDRWNHVRCECDSDRGVLSVVLDGDESPAGRTECLFTPSPIPTNDRELTIGIRRNFEFGEFEEAPLLGLIDELWIRKKR